jgi:hypothetical protein
MSVMAGDVNDDTFLDLVSANYLSDTVSVLLGNGDGTFEARTDFATGSVPVMAKLGDLNGDGMLDVAAANNGSNNVSVLLGNGDGTFATHTDFAAGPYQYTVITADLNHDSVLDLAVSHTSGYVSVLLGNGDGTFRAHTDYPVGDGPWSIAVGDVNRDTFPDLVVADYYSVDLLMLLGNGDGMFGTPTEFATARSPITVAVHDLNGDTVPDLVTSNEGGNTVSVLLNLTPAPTVPGAPTIGTAIAGNQSATVSWSAPASNGGSPVTGYVVTPYVGYWPLPSVPFNSTVTTQTVTGLTNGTTYRFRVQAVNAIGVSGYSKVTNPVTPSA